ncbi:MAG: DUF1294 domain-containing protein, partial [Chloroflexi bacterium]|nr:DUF1294 domain-containing protein [Chloroflexota bacterium]
VSQASPDSFTYFLFVYFVLNLLTIAVFGWDKLCAMMGRPRIRQRTLFILMATGGSLVSMFTAYGSPALLMAWTGN